MRDLIKTRKNDESDETVSQKKSRKLRPICQTLRTPGRHPNQRLYFELTKFSRFVLLKIMLSS